MRKARTECDESECRISCAVSRDVKSHEQLIVGMSWIKLRLIKLRLIKLRLIKLRLESLTSDLEQIRGNQGEAQWTPACDAKQCTHVVAVEESM